MPQKLTYQELIRFEELNKKWAAPPRKGYLLGTGKVQPTAPVTMGTSTRPIILPAFSARLEPLPAKKRICPHCGAADATIADYVTTPLFHTPKPSKDVLLAVFPVANILQLSIPRFHCQSCGHEWVQENTLQFSNQPVTLYLARDLAISFLDSRLSLASLVMHAGCSEEVGRAILYELAFNTFGDQQIATDFLERPQRCPIKVPERISEVLVEEVCDHKKPLMTILRNPQGQVIFWSRKTGKDLVPSFGKWAKGHLDEHLHVTAQNGISCLPGFQELLPHCSYTLTW